MATISVVSKTIIDENTKTFLNLPEPLRTEIDHWPLYVQRCFYSIGKMYPDLSPGDPIDIYIDHYTLTQNSRSRDNIKLKKFAIENKIGYTQSKNFINELIVTERGCNLITTLVTLATLKATGLSIDVYNTKKGKKALPVSSTNEPTAIIGTLYGVEMSGTHHCMLAGKQSFKKKIVKTVDLKEIDAIRVPRVRNANTPIKNKVTEISPIGFQDVSFLHPTAEIKRRIIFSDETVINADLYDYIIHKYPEVIFIKPSNPETRKLYQSVWLTLPGYKKASDIIGAVAPLRV